jgi:hypothetical protein
VLITEQRKSSCCSYEGGDECGIGTHVDGWRKVVGKCVRSLRLGARKNAVEMGVKRVWCRERRKNEQLEVRWPKS